MRYCNMHPFAIPCSFTVVDARAFCISHCCYGILSHTQDKSRLEIDMEGRTSRYNEYTEMDVQVSEFTSTPSLPLFPLLLHVLYPHCREERGHVISPID
jgi:hypothetical protein